MKTRGIVIFLCIVLASLSLVGCGLIPSDDKSAAKDKDDKQEKAKLEEEIARADAKSLLAFLYEGKKGTVKDVTGMTADDTTASLERAVYERNMKEFPGDDWKLVVDGSTYSAEQIIQDYSRVFIRTFHSITYSVEDVKITNDPAEVTAKIDPIALLSVANGVTHARSDVFGDLETSKKILESQNKDVKAINNLINFKLYSIIYGDRNRPIPTVGEEKEITFTMTKSGDHYQVSKETLMDILADSLEDAYTKKDSGDK